MDPGKIATLAALADGIIPADAIDGGAASVQAGPRLAEKVEKGTQKSLYLDGLETAQAVAKERFDREVAALGPEELHALLAAVREMRPGFFKQLRMDVSALYLSDPEVWRRIGFPGPSTASGGYPDFDRPQTEKADRLKEP